MCLSIGTPKNNKFSICFKWKIENYSLIIMCLNIGTPNNHHFPFGINGKVVVIGVPILKHFRVYKSIGFQIQESHQYFNNLRTKQIQLTNIPFIVNKKKFARNSAVKKRMQNNEYAKVPEKF